MSDGTATAGRWLAGASPVDGGLLLPGLPADRGCDLVLGPDGASVVAGLVSAGLAWGDYGLQLGHRTPDRWTVTPWSTSRGAMTGVAVTVEGGYATATEAVRRARRSFGNALARFLQGGAAVPLCAEGRRSPVVEADRRLVALLCSLLSDRPEMRARLGDPERTGRLAADLTSQPHDPVPSRQGAGRPMAAIFDSLAALGYEHPLGGRPLPGDPVAPVDEVTAMVVADLRANPAADEATIRHVVTHHYAVAPWPFGALLD